MFALADALEAARDKISKVESEDSGKPLACRCATPLPSFFRMTHATLMIFRV